MALIDCPDCRREVSDLAHSCPRCGYPVRSLLETQTPRPSDEGTKAHKGAPIANKLVLQYLGIILLLVVVVGVVTQIAFGWADTKEQRAYDEAYGRYWETAEENNSILSCQSLTAAHDAAVEALNEGADRDDVLLQLQQQYDKVMRRVSGAGSYYGEAQPYFISGYWDAANVKCPLAFFEITFVGRPGR